MEYEKYNQVIKTTANKNNLPYVDAFNVLQGKVETDGWDPIYPVYQFHPNRLNILVDLIQGQLLPKSSHQIYNYKKNKDSNIWNLRITTLWKIVSITVISISLLTKVLSFLRI